MKKLFLAAALALGLAGCVPLSQVPFSPNPVVRIVYRQQPTFGVRRGGWTGFPVAIEVYNPNGFGVLADIDCTYAHYKWEHIPALSARQFPISIGDGNCNVTFWR